jgi:hypothetical protein
MKSVDDGTRYAGLAARALATDDDAPAAASGPGDRTEDVAAIERALRARTRTGLGRWTIAAGAAAIVVVAVAVAWRGAPWRSAEQVPAAGPPIVAAAPVGARRPPALAIAMIEGEGALGGPSGSERRVTVGDEVVAGTRIEVAPAGAVTLALATGTRVDLGAGARARVVDLEEVQRFDLRAGVLAARVAKLTAGRRFVVETPDVEVEVRGTRFEVGVTSAPVPCDASVRTVVTVQEGVVAIRHAGREVRVPAGERWPDCRPPRAAAAAAPARHVPRASAAAAPASEAQPSPSSTLAEQNDLFAAALAARRRGDVDGELHLLEQLIARHPVGQLTDSARAERRRLLEAAGRKAPRD